uniref:Molybdopterin synthase sulfur carrier subunit n=1 Tax=Neobodo designis TaxID=312471 RepID=A0A7S1QZR3_NEODS
MYTVLLFGDVKAQAGTSSVLVPPPASGGEHTALSLLEALRSGVGVLNGATKAPFAAPASWADLVRPAVLAVDMEYVAGDGLGRTIAATAEVALIPPISGG